MVLRRSRVRGVSSDLLGVFSAPAPINCSFTLYGFVVFARNAFLDCINSDISRRGSASPCSSGMFAAPTCACSLLLVSGTPATERTAETMSFPSLARTDLSRMTHPFSARTWIGCCHCCTRECKPATDFDLIRFYSHKLARRRIGANTCPLDRLDAAQCAEKSCDVRSAPACRLRRQILSLLAPVIGNGNRLR